MTERPPSPVREAKTGGQQPTNNGQGVVELWAACFADVPVLPESWVKPLDARERRELGRDQSRRAIGYAGRHLLMREVLGAAVGEAPEKLRFELGAFGKPTLAGDHTRPAFSLSSSGEVAVLALRQGAAVGVDIASVGAIEAGLSKLFTPAEQAVVAPLQEPDLSIALHRLWVAKEAVLKASGTGLSVAPDCVDVEPPWNGVAPMRASLLGGGPTTYFVRPFRLTATVIGAVACEQDLVATLRWWRRCQWRADCSACTTSLIA